MNQPQVTFSVKSSNRFVANSIVQEYEPPADETMEPKDNKPVTIQESDRKEGSESGLCVRTTNTSAEDYY